MDICGSYDPDLLYVLDAELMGSVDSIDIEVEDSILTG